MNAQSNLEFDQNQNVVETAPQNVIATKLASLLDEVSVKMEEVMIKNGIPGAMTKEYITTLMRIAIDEHKEKINNEKNQYEWFQSHILTTSVMQFLDLAVVTSSPKLITLKLNSKELFNMSVVAPEVRMKNAQKLLGYLCKREVISYQDKIWRPVPFFAEKGLFGYSTFAIPSKKKPSKLIHTLKLTFKGKCFLTVLLSYSEFGARDLYSKTFAKEIL